MKTLKLLSLVCALIGLPLPVSAHHSAAQFDFDQMVYVDGVVELIEVRNPHIKLIMSVTSDSGQVKKIEYEGHSRNNVFRLGWRPGDIEIGDRLTIGIAPLRSGSDEGGYIRSFETAAGKQF